MPEFPVGGFSSEKESLDVVVDTNAKEVRERGPLMVPYKELNPPAPPFLFPWANKIASTCSEKIWMIQDGGARFAMA